MKPLISRLLQTRLRLPEIPGRPVDPDAPLLFGFNRERDEIITGVADRLVHRYRGLPPERLLYTLNEAANAELRRLTLQRDGEAEAELDGWKKLARKVGGMSHSRRLKTMHRISARIAADVAGNFDPRVYRLVLQVVPGLLTGIMTPADLPLELVRSGWSQLDRRLSVEGPVAKLRRLARLGTLILVPTHSSNLDSIALGYSLAREGLPPVVYGAGKNLFSNPLISFFMHNLGAYRVDRRIQAPLYKEVLKGFSFEVIRRGYHSLFFPGGTRSRAGVVERHLKLGLAGTAVEAFAHNQVSGHPRPVFFVPVTINYGLVLEAETLIEDHLKGEGQGRYIITDDEFSRVGRLVAFFNKLTRLRSAAVIRFSEPFDPFCNPVDDLGRSLGPGGHKLDPGTYVRRHGAPVIDAARDAGYTRELGELLPRVYARETVIMWTQLVAHVLYRHLVQSTPGRDLWNRHRVHDVTMPRDQLIAACGHARDRLLALEAEGQIRVDPTVRCELPERIVADALDAWSGYHTTTVVSERDGAVQLVDPNLLLYYQNRLVGLAEELATEDTLAAARRITEEVSR
ncbi:MAG: 1-acyl-sn-glycerol-3-phosphate acyltransferase [Nannocystaceae bacterium]|nr:1-acyl-sn-glycerol-3-phosphate acyltransferase [Myxococcales bacterium]